MVDQNIDEPFGLCIFLALRDAERHRRHREHADQLPAPERELRHRAPREPGVAGALHDVVAGTHQGTATEGEDDTEGMVRPQAAERQPRQVEIQGWPRQLGRRVHADQHADDAPYARRQQEQSHDVVVVVFGTCHRGLCLEELS
jgi:hypothetical protein